MARPPSPLMSFRRTFSWLILLVVVPSAGLSGFGVLAIINERAAVEKRLGQAWAGRLTTMAQRLKGALEELEVAPSPEGLAARLPHGPILSTAGFRLRGGTAVSTDPTLQVLLRSVAPQLPELPEQPVAFSIAGPQGTALLVAERRGDETLGAALSLAQVQALLSRLGRDLPGAAEVQFILKPVRVETGDSLVRKLVSGMAQAREVLGPPALAERLLPPPLQDFRLEAVPLGQDPVALASTRNRIVYAILLGVFYVTLAGGVIYTGRVLYRESRLSRLKTDFVSLVSHELRTPLTSIRMFIETLALGRVRDPEETREVLALLVRETERLSQMIERVLDWARLESGRMRLERHTVSVESLVDAALAAFRAQRLDAGPALQADVAPGLPPVNVDREAMAGALLNLLHNAFKYTGPDKRIALRARQEGKGVSIAVEDNGIGIAPRDRRRIFERFYRVDNLLTRKTEGSGLGLAISRRIVESHGGRLTVKSTLGKGSCFTLHLPAAREAGDRHP